MEEAAFNTALSLFMSGFYFSKVRSFQFINYFTAVREANGEVLLPVVIVSL